MKLRESAKHKVVSISKDERGRTVIACSCGATCHDDGDLIAKEIFETHADPIVGE